VRPSPVKFTSQRPDQFPVKPEPERINHQAGHDAMKHKMLSLENLKESLPDFSRHKEEDDDEVTKITGGNDDPGNHVSTRHITPQIFDSGATSRTLSASSSQAESRPTTSQGTMMAKMTSPSVTVTTASEAAASFEVKDNRRDCQAGGLHPPSKASMKDFVRIAQRRIKYISVCSGSLGMPVEIAAEVMVFFIIIFESLEVHKVAPWNVRAQPKSRFDIFRKGISSIALGVSVTFLILPACLVKRPNKFQKIIFNYF
jgi:hypothetical protein